MAMTIKPSRPRAFLKTFVLYFFIISVMTLVAPFPSGSSGIGENVGFSVFGGAVFGLLVAFVFTPHEITWDDNGIRIRAVFLGTAEGHWSRLEAYSPFSRGLFLIKLEGKQAFQIYPAGLPTEEWKAFQQFLRQRFPEKKAWVWLGVTPLIFRNRKL
jgi:hypothetical protein